MDLTDNRLQNRITDRDFNYYKNPRAGCHMGFDGDCPYPTCSDCPIGKLYKKMQYFENLIEDKQASTIPFEKIKDLYNEICKSYPKVTKLSDKRNRAIKKCFKDGYTLEDFQKAFTYAENCPFMKGDNKQKWKSSFDWLIDSNNIVKAIEGNYGNGKADEHSYDLDKFEQMAYSAKK